MQMQPFSLTSAVESDESESEKSQEQNKEEENSNLLNKMVNF